MSWFTLLFLLITFLSFSQGTKTANPNPPYALAAKEGRARHIGRRVRKDGTTFWGSILITALHSKVGNVIGFAKLTRELRDNEIE